MTAACTGRWISAPPSARRCMPRQTVRWKPRTTGMAAAPKATPTAMATWSSCAMRITAAARLETLYAHLSKLCVAQGETVYEGQLIGYSGDTGNCYGAHLHFEVRYKNRRVHPLNWLDADFAAASTAVRLGGYQSVARPAAEKTQPVQMQMVTVGPISNGDAARLYALCGDLGLVESGLYHAAYTEV